MFFLESFLLYYYGKNKHENTRVGAYGQAYSCIAAFS